MTLNPARWRRRAEDRCGAKPRGDPWFDVPSLWCSSAHSQHRVRSSCRGGGGNITGFDFMWVIGRVQSAVAMRRSVSALASRPPGEAGERKE